MMTTCARICVALGVFASCHRGEPPVKRPPEEKAPVVTPKTEPPVPTPESAPTMPKSEAFPACPGARAFSLDLTGWSQERVSERFGPPAERETYRAGDRGGEFYAGLKNVYPSKVPATETSPSKNGPGLPAIAF
jgi:hypothetical protein